MDEIFWRRVCRIFFYDLERYYSNDIKIVRLLDVIENVFILFYLERLFYYMGFYGGGIVLSLIRFV